jgi:hypothetical protein
MWFKDLTEIGLIYMAVDRGELEDVVDTDMNIWVPYNGGIL